MYPIEVVRYEEGKTNLNGNIPSKFNIPKQRRRCFPRDSCRCSQARRPTRSGISEWSCLIRQSRACFRSKSRPSRSGPGCLRCNEDKVSTSCHNSSDRRDLRAGRPRRAMGVEGRGGREVVRRLGIERYWTTMGGYNCGKEADTTGTATTLTTVDVVVVVVSKTRSRERGICRCSAEPTTFQLLPPDITTSTLSFRSPSPTHLPSLFYCNPMRQLGLD